MIRRVRAGRRYDPRAMSKVKRRVLKRESVRQLNREILLDSQKLRRGNIKRSG